jgi:hypothetical protein
MKLEIGRSLTPPMIETLNCLTLCDRWKGKIDTRVGKLFEVRTEIVEAGKSTEDIDERRMLIGQDKAVREELEVLNLASRKVENKRTALLAEEKSAIMEYKFTL